MYNNQKQRLFEVMEKVNPDFKMRINEELPPNPNFQLNTYGDLKKLINYIKIGKKGGNLLIQGKDFAVDQL